MTSIGVIFALELSAPPSAMGLEGEADIRSHVHLIRAEP